MIVEYAPQLITALSTLSGVGLTLLFNYLSNQRGNVKFFVESYSITPLTFDKYSQPIEKEIEEAKCLRIKVNAGLYNSSGNVKHLKDFKLILIGANSSTKHEIILEDARTKRKDKDNFFNITEDFKYRNVKPREYEEIRLEKDFIFNSDDAKQEINLPLTLQLEYKIQKKKFLKDSYYYEDKREYLTTIK